MIAANEYRGPATASTPTSERILDPYQPQSYLERRTPLAIIIDIESRKWNFKVHAGKLHRFLHTSPIADEIRGSEAYCHEHIWKCAKVHRLGVYHGATKSSKCIWDELCR